MRKKPLLVLVILILAAVLPVALFACTENSSDGGILKSLDVVSLPDGKYVIGEEVDFGAIKLKAVYADGEVREIVLEDSMLSEEDRGKFFIAGVHSITANYQDKQVVFQIEVEARVSSARYTAEFYSNGGSEVDPQSDVNVITNIVIPTRAGYTFVGWYANPELEGNKLVTPYTLNANTKFYAKWEDERRCTITFKDGDDVKDSFEVVYGEKINIGLDEKEENVIVSGIKIRKTEFSRFTVPAERKGYSFKGWVSKSGVVLTDEIVSDVEIVANYERIVCTIVIECVDRESGRLITKAGRYYYGEFFSISEYVMETKEGYNSRWVYRRSHTGDAAVDFPTDSSFFTVEEDLDIFAEHTIKTYNVTVSNGKGVDEKPNDVTVRYDEDMNYRVEHNGGFSLSGFVGAVSLATPKHVSDGFSAEWGYWDYIMTADNRTERVLRNADNKIWNENAKCFEQEEGNYVTREFDLHTQGFDDGGNVVLVTIAHVSNGNLQNVKGDVSIMAKYYKNKYTVTLYRLNGKEWKSFDNFTLEYWTNFALYDPRIYKVEKYEDDKKFNCSTASEIENLYRLHNVADWTKASQADEDNIPDKWIYALYENGGSVDDWGVEWYVRSDGLNKTVDFTVQGKDSETGEDILGSYRVTRDISLYCEDVDLRVYSVHLLYDYDFSKDPSAPQYNYGYNKVKDYSGLKEKSALELPADAVGSIVRTYTDYNHDNKTTNVTYEFDGWYDYPYEPDGTGYKGTRYDSLDIRTKTMTYYAHYRCNTKYTLTVVDKTQREAYSGTSLDNSGYDVPEDSIVFTVPAGTEINADMIYKGLMGEKGMISGQSIYEKAKLIEDVLGKGGEQKPNGALTSEYEAILEEYGEGGTDALTALRREIDELTQLILGYENIFVYARSYNFAMLDLQYFTDNYMTVPQYNDKRKELQTLKNKEELLLTYADKLSEAKVYLAERPNYHKYLDSEEDLNKAYKKTAVDEYKYRFSGWYTDAQYASLYYGKRDMYFTWLAVGQSLTLYAKWADEEKGSEGLVFEMVTDLNGKKGLVVVDYINKSDYENSKYYGCDYNKFDEGAIYSINLNDQDEVPIELDMNADIQIPATHGGTNTEGIPVIGIARGAFIVHGDRLKTITLSKDIKFLEEGAFINCNLETVSGKSNEWVEIQEERAVYQKEACSVGNYGVQGNTLIVYANRFVGSDTVSASEFVVASGTKKIGDYAFYGAVKIKTVELGADITDIGERAFSDSGFSGTKENGTLEINDKLQEIGRYAFYNCAEIEDIELSSSSKLCKVGDGSLSTTNWYAKQKGLVSLNGLIIGVRNVSEKELDMDGEIKKRTVLENGITVFSYTNEYGVIYYDANKTGLPVAAVRIGSGAQGISEYAFADSSGSLGIMYVESTLAKFGIAQYAFKNCVNLSNMFMSDLVCQVEESAFYGCADVQIKSFGSNRNESWNNCSNIDILP